MTELTQQDVAPRVTSLGDLRSTRYIARSIRDEVRCNLITAIRSGDELFPGIMGYEHTVVPGIVNALLASQDVLLLGERGQAKTRLARSLTRYLDEWIPVLEGTDIPDDPFAPVTARGRATIAGSGDRAQIRWLHRSERFAEKLATPDTTIADLIGEIDPIKIAEGRYLNDEEALTPGLILASNRSIFNLNELPDLSERIQVGLLNILEERDVQIRGFKMRMPLDLLVVASANPEDYTNRGRIITPLKDRFGSQVRTHYPDTAELESRIADQERISRPIPGVRVVFPALMKQLLAQATQVARHSEDISSRSGVSVRATIANFELVEASAVQRALRRGDDVAAPRVSDLGACVESMVGKLEFEHFGNRSEQDIVRLIFGEAISRVFASTMTEQQIAPVEEAFAHGFALDFGLWTAAQELCDRMAMVPGLEIPQQYQNSPAERASWFELMLEGMHQHGLLQRHDVGQVVRYEAERP